MAIQCNVAIATYLDHLRIERGLSANSISSYSRDLDKYQSLLSEKGLSYEKVTESDISTFIGELSIQGLSPSSINRFLSTLKGFYKYCALEYQVANPMVDINQFKLARKLPKALSVDEVSRLIESTINPADPTMLRDRAILEILYGTGARVAELIGLDINDISKDDFDGEEITIIKLRGKGSKERLVPIGRYALEALDNYLVRLRPALLAKNSHNERALFLNARGTRLSRQSAWTTVLKAAEAVGLAGRVSPHVFRHSYATHLLDGGADIRVVQELLGHASVTTTQIYTLVTIDKVRESYSLAHPRSK
jgi:integrase/recombinase XerD